ncbi:hypothetical protein B0T13DRAFT_433271 [Neurospora crassa]|nr:hypothetical protein B0T13DRAFT_433271 [Neurospora crassa]
MRRGKSLSEATMHPQGARSAPIYSPGGFKPPSFGVVPKAHSDVRQPTRISSTHVVVEPISAKERPWVPSDGLYQEINKQAMHERKLAIIGVDDRLLKPLPLKKHPFHTLDYIPFARSSLEAMAAIEDGLKGVAKLLKLDGIGVDVSPVVPRQVVSIRESGWRPTQLGFEHIRWPTTSEEHKDVEFQSDWYEILWYDIMKRVYRWAEKYFDEQQDVKVSAKSVKDWTNLWKQAGVSDHFVHYASLVARQDNSHPAGWDVLLAKGRYRKFLMVGVLVRLLQEQVFDELLFGADKATKRMLETQDECYIELDGYFRTEMRCKSVRAALDESILTPGFWPEVDKLAIQTTALFSPLLRFMDVEFEKRTDPLEFHQDIHDIIAESGYFNIAIRLSRDIFRFNWPLPGDGWSLEVENVDDVPFEISRAWADKHEQDAQKRYHAGLEADRRRKKRRKELGLDGRTTRTTVAMARGTLQLALDHASTKLKSGLAATDVKLARLRPGFVAPTVDDPPPASEPDYSRPSDPNRPPELYLPSRLAKTQIAIFPAVQRYMNLETFRREPVKKNPSLSFSFHTNDIMASIESHPTYEYYFDQLLPRNPPKKEDSSDEGYTFPTARRRKHLVNPFDRQEDAQAIHTIAKGNAIYYSGVADESHLSALRRSANDPSVGPEKYYVGYPGYLPEHVPTLREWTNLPLTSRHSSHSRHSLNNLSSSSRTSSPFFSYFVPSNKTLILARRLLFTMLIYFLLRFLLVPLLFPAFLPFFLALESTALHIFNQVKDGLTALFTPLVDAARPLLGHLLHTLTLLRNLALAVLKPVLAPVGDLVKKLVLPPLASALRAVGYVYSQLVDRGPVGWVWTRLKGAIGWWGDWVKLVDEAVKGGLARVDAWLGGATGATVLPEAWRRSGAGGGVGGGGGLMTTVTTATTATTTMMGAAAGGGGGNWNPFARRIGSDLKTEKTTYTVTTNGGEEVFTVTEKRTAGGSLTFGRTSTASTVTTGDGTFTLAGAAPPPPLTP